MGTATKRKKPVGYKPAGHVGVLLWLPLSIRHELRETAERTGHTQQDLLRRGLRRELARHVRIEEGES